jgi:uncharacterized membrane protein (UPF0127 family)
MNKKILIIVLILAMTAIVFTIFPSLHSDKKNDVSEPKSAQKTNTLPEPKFRDEGNLYIIRGTDTLPQLDIEVADTEIERERGLMFRTSLGEEQSMLFIFENEAPRSFWMKDTYIALDLLFINTDNKIVHIQENAPAYNTKPIRSAKPALYVLEVNAGYVKENGVRLGDEIRVVL